jgi:hypothetical protein
MKLEIGSIWNDKSKCQFHVCFTDCSRFRFFALVLKSAIRLMTWATVRMQRLQFIRHKSANVRRSHASHIKYQFRHKIVRLSFYRRAGTWRRFRISPMISSSQILSLPRKSFIKFKVIGSFSFWKIWKLCVS